MNSTLIQPPAATSPSRRCKDCGQNDHAPGRPICWGCLNNRLPYQNSTGRCSSQYEVRAKQRRIAAGGDLEV